MADRDRALDEQPAFQQGGGGYGQPPPPNYHNQQHYGQPPPQQQQYYNQPPPQQQQYGGQPQPYTNNNNNPYQPPQQTQQQPYQSQQSKPTSFLDGFFNGLSNLFSSNQVEIKSHLKHTVLFPGNVVEGFVEVIVKAPMNFRAVRVKLAAKELVFVERHTRIRKNPPPGSPPNTPATYETIVEKKNSKVGIYKSLVTLAGAMKTIPMGYPSVMLDPGTYTYPFSFQLPTHVPPSFSRKVNDDFAELLYYVKTYVDGSNGERVVMHKNFLTVIRPMPISQYNMAAPYNQFKSFDLTCCCCCNKGKVSLTMMMSRTLIAIDRDEVEVICDVDNTLGEEPVEKMHLRLTNDVTYRVENLAERGQIVVGTGTFTQRVEAGQRGRMSGKMQIQKNGLPTIKTPNVEIRYTMSASLDIPWVDDPSFPINVMVAQTVDPSNYAKPLQWNEPAFVPLKKAQHSVREAYWQPPPQPVYQVNMFQSMPPPPPSVPMVDYSYQLPPYGLPPQAWQQGAPPTVHGQPYQAMQPQQQIQWQQGLTQTAV